MPQDFKMFNNKSLPNHPKKQPVQEFSEVFVWGSDKHLQLGIDSQFLGQDPTKRPIVHTLPRVCSFNVVIQQVACGLAHTALLTQQGHLYTMGSNSYG